MRIMYMWMMELELQLDAFLDSPYFAENRPADFYNNDQLTFGVCTRAFSLLARAGYPLVVPVHLNTTTWLSTQYPGPGSGRSRTGVFVRFCSVIKV
jgi:hypothetical protein